jgi:tetratricopeptide (TPR) repeat protein
VKQEKLPWLADNPFYTKRFAFYVGRRCRSSAIRDVARELRLDWKTVKALEMEYLREQLRRVGTPAPTVIGIDEISIRKGHTYRIVVTDLLRGRAIWFGGADRSEASMDLFFAWLGPRKCRKIRLAVMDRWTAFRKSTLKPDHAQAYNALGYTLADRTDRFKEAKGYIEKALKLSPDDPFILDSMGWVLYRLGDQAEALGYLQRAYALRPDPEIAAHIGEVMWARGQRGDAEKLWRDASKESPDNEMLQATMKRFLR